MGEREEPSQDIAHPGHVGLPTPQPNESLWNSKDILGMEVVAGVGHIACPRGA